MPTEPGGPRGSSGRGWVVWLLLLAIGGGAWYFRDRWLPLIAAGTASDAPKGKPAARAVPVRTATAVRRDLDLYLNGLGTVTAYNTVTLKSRVEGELTKVEFDEGELVKEGDLLAEIDPRPFEVQLQQAEGQLARNQATLKLAEANLTRLRQLARSRTITSQEIEEQEALVAQTKAQIRADEAMVNNAKLQLTYCRIVAPISGKIGLRQVDLGNIVRANDLNGMAVITQMDPIAVIFTIPQDEIPRVQRRMRDEDTLTVEAFDRGFRTKLASGKLAAIDNQVDATTGTLRLKGEFDNKDRTLFPNQFVNVKLLVETLQNAIVVPAAAVQRGPDNQFVYVVKGDKTVELRTVVPGPSEGSEVSIASGLESGEVVVTDGLDKLQPGAKVMLQETASRSAGTAAD